MRRLRHLLPVLVIVGLLVGLVPPVGAADADASKIEPSLAAAIAKNPKKKFQVIVQAEPAKTKAKRRDQQQALAKQLREKDEDGEPGKIRAALGLVNGFAGELKGKQILKLSKNKNVKAISGDHKIKLSETSTADISLNDGIVPSSAAGLKSMQTLVAEAPDVWAATGAQGQGVTVAVLDSGINAQHPDLSTNAVFGIDIATNTTTLADPGGHGTHVAGIIAGTGAQSAGKWKGVAPGTRVMSVKVTNDTGGGTYSSLIMGLQWIVANRHIHNIRVANMSLGATPVTSYKDDPLVAAAELAWFSGIVVVTSAGNNGSTAGTITVPANDPYLIAVGAANDKNTIGTGDDAIPFWSSRGPTSYDGLQKPDVVAGGNRVVSTRSPASYLEQILGLLRIVDTHYYRMSGTSMAAPVVSGVAALILSSNPALTPNQVKHIIKATAQPYAFVGPNTQGAGRVDAAAAVQMATSGSPIPSANLNQRPSNIFARSIYTLAFGAPVQWRDSNYLGRNWNNWTWDGTNSGWDNSGWDNTAWDNLLWDAIDWTNTGWTSLDWTDLTGWTNSGWDNSGWDNSGWDNSGWDNSGWDNSGWDNSGWDNAGWDFAGNDEE